MNKSESKYFNTAARMDAAFLKLLENKDFDYIIVKEICEQAGVNRSTFYLHYETVSDLISECVEYVMRQFFESIQVDPAKFMKKIQDCPMEELYLITPEYLVPYLNYVKQNRRLFQTMLKNAAVLRMEDCYLKLFGQVFTPILNRFQAPLGEGRGGLFENPVLKEIGAKYGKTAAQVMLRWNIQRGVVVLPKSTHYERMKESIDVFDFVLTDDDMQKIASLDKKESAFFSHYDPAIVEWFVQLIDDRKNRT